MAFMNDDSSTQNQVPFTDPDNVKLEDLVGEGKKYKDQEALAKAIAHSQNQIHSLTNGMDELRADLQTRSTVEEALNKLNQPTKQVTEPTTPVEPQEQVSSDDVKGLTEEDVRKLLTDTLTSREVEGSKQANLQKAQSAVASIHGSNAEEFIAGKAQELGLSVDQLKAQAESSPTAFFKLLDIKTDGPAPTAKPQTYTKPTVKRAADPNALETREDFLALKKQKPIDFWHPKVQQKWLKLEMEEAAKTQT
jgi:hypothetical protein